MTRLLGGAACSGLALALVLMTSRAAAEPDPPLFDEQTPPPIPVAKSDSPPGYERYLLPYAPLPQMPAPRLLPYEEGQSVPYGYRVRQRPTRSLLVAGAITFGVSYLTSLISAAGLVAQGGSDNKRYAPLFAPVVGPFVAIGTIGSASATPMLVLDALSQLGGMTLLICGGVIDEKLLERTTTMEGLLHPRVIATPRSVALSWSVR